MSLKAELERWAAALDAYDAGDMSSALSNFDYIADSSKVLFNIGLIHATLAHHEQAVQYYAQAHLLDQYLAVSFFQSGVSYFLLQDFPRAHQDFENAFLHMRENQIIDYEQLGLRFRLYSAEILFNQGLSMIRQGQQQAGMKLLDTARREKQTDEHSVIDEAYNEQGRNFTVFSVPVGVLFRPAAIKLKNLKAKNYLGTAKLVAATDPADAFIGFSGLGPSKKRSSSVKSDQNDTITTPTSRPSPPVKQKMLPTDTSIPRRLVSTRRPSDATVALRPPSVPSQNSPQRVRSSSESTAAGIGLIMQRQRKDDNRNVFSLAQTDSVYTVGESPYGGFSGETSTPAPQPVSQNVRLPTPASSPLSEKGLAGIAGIGSQRTRAQAQKPASAAGSLAFAKPERDELEELLGSYSAVSNSASRTDDRVAEWAASQTSASHATKLSRSDLPRLAIPTGVGGEKGSVRRQATVSSSGQRSAASGRSLEMVSFRLKVHYDGDIRGMSIDSSTAYAEFVSRLRDKFDLDEMHLKYKDEDGVFISIIDETDWESAVDAAREHCPNGRQDGKLEVWVD